MLDIDNDSSNKNEGIKVCKEKKRIRKNTSKERPFWRALQISNKYLETYKDAFFDTIILLKRKNGLIVNAEVLEYLLSFYSENKDRYFNIEKQMKENGEFVNDDLFLDIKNWNKSLNGYFWKGVSFSEKNFSFFESLRYDVILYTRVCKINAHQIIIYLLNFYMKARKFRKFKEKIEEKK